MRIHTIVAAIIAATQSGVVRAEDGKLTGRPTFSMLVGKVTEALQEDPRFDDASHGYPEGSQEDRQRDPYCCDILVPGDGGEMYAVIRSGFYPNSKLMQVCFTWDGEKVTISDEEPKSVNRVEVYARELEVEDATIRATGNTEGAKKGWEHRGKPTELKIKWSGGPNSLGNISDFKPAKSGEVGTAKYTALSRDGKKELWNERRAMHVDTAERAGLVTPHDESAPKTPHHYESFEPFTKAADQSHETDIIHCKDSGVEIAATAKWVVDEEVDFQWMPGGVTTVTASYDGSPIELTVDCDEDAAKAVQASFNSWVATYPKQKPFGCVEHREQEAAVIPTGFEWRDTPEPGVYCKATPTALGAKNVNGRIHRSWSPSFRTNAQYNKSKLVNGVRVFEKGAIGAKDNPAKITGVAFSVGSLTNMPAFKNILPVRAREQGQVNIGKTAKSSSPGALRTIDQIFASLEPVEEPPVKARSIDDIFASLLEQGRAE